MGGQGSGRKATNCGHGISKSQCKTCKAAKGRLRYGPTNPLRNKVHASKVVREYKIALEHCSICKIKIDETNFMMFALDHRDPAKKLFNLSDARSKPIDLVMAECRKCELMCHNCHHLKTHQNRDHLIRRDESVIQDEYLPLLLLMQDCQ
jgi:hypothetical protein